MILQYDNYGSHRIFDPISGKKSPWTAYQSISTMTVDGSQYMGYSDYWGDSAGVYRTHFLGNQVEVVNGIRPE